MKNIAFVIALLLMGWSAYAQHDHAQHSTPAQTAEAPTFKDARLTTAYTHYLQLKDALVASNATKAKQAAAALKQSAETLTNGKKVSASAGIIAAASDLEAQRKEFATLSTEMKTLVSGNVASGSLYLEYCPMANNHTGAYWLSNDKQIMNPYFGDMMLHCGSVKETIQ
ncbi:MAG TPA: DUF3347 domain-containing protein [Ohtaekwangia sp.]|uniref:DUF3347 domain-containing protein n=1 Tax=Ohtaekwangia sp. TaxID=2066019 RepID=UPI002F9219E7